MNPIYLSGLDYTQTLKAIMRDIWGYTFNVYGLIQYRVRIIQWITCRQTICLENDQSLSFS